MPISEPVEHVKVDFLTVCPSNRIFKSILLRNKCVWVDQPINWWAWEYENNQITPKSIGIFPALFVLLGFIPILFLWGACSWTQARSVEQKQTTQRTSHSVGIQYRIWVNKSTFSRAGWLSSTNIWGAPVDRPYHSSVDAGWCCCGYVRASQFTKAQTTKVSKQSSTVSKINIGSSFQCKQCCK